MCLRYIVKRESASIGLPAPAALALATRDEVLNWAPQVGHVVCASGLEDFAAALRAGSGVDLHSVRVA
jgi:hypothetical protein